MYKRQQIDYIDGSEDLDNREIEIGLVSNGELSNYLGFPLLAGWSTTIQIDRNVYRNIRKEIISAKKIGTTYTNIKEVYNACRKVLNWIPINMVKEDPSRRLVIKDRYLNIHYTKTYLMKNKRNSLYKIGKSKNPKHREKTLQSQEPEISIVKIWNKDIERDLHIKYDEYRVRGEWFKLNKIQVKYICTKY